MDYLKALHNMQKYSAELQAAMMACTEVVKELGDAGADDLELGISIVEYEGSDVINLSVAKESNGQLLGMTGWHVDTEIRKAEIQLGVYQILKRYEAEIGPVSLSKADLN